jgi:hypothetical protein
MKNVRSRIRMRLLVLTAASMKITVFGLLRCVVWYKLTNVSEVLTALMMEAVSISETSVHFYQTTQHNIPEDSHFQELGCLSLLNTRRDE